MSETAARYETVKPLAGAPGVAPSPSVPLSPSVAMDSPRWLVDPALSVAPRSSPPSPEQPTESPPSPLDLRELARIMALQIEATSRLALAVASLAQIAADQQDPDRVGDPDAVMSTR